MEICQMTFNKKAQCKGTYQQYLANYSRQLLSQLTPEARQQLAEQVQARVVLGGEQPINQEVYQDIMNLSI